MAKNTTITIYLNAEQMAELERRAKYKRQSNGDWVKARILSSLGLNPAKPVEKASSPV